MNDTDHFAIVRLGAEHSAAIGRCFRRVYGDSYANDLFYDTQALTEAIAAQRVRSVGALRGGEVFGHMAMNLTNANALYVELGNTVVDPQARGAGLAWRVGAELTAWSRELGYTGFLHYPTTDHHIMQRRSVERGFEIGLMLSYVPAETDGQVTQRAQSRRGAATIVFEPLAKRQAHRTAYLPRAFDRLLVEFAEVCDIPREWQPCTARSYSNPSLTTIEKHTRRGLTRLRIDRTGADIADAVTQLSDIDTPCQQIDIALADPGIDHAVNVALDQGFFFCGWLPGYSTDDVLRLQRVEPQSTDMSPNVVNPGAQRLLDEFGV